MSILACQDYVANVIQGLVGAYGNEPLQAWVDPPSGGIASAETPQAYVQAASGEGKRQTMGGLTGYYLDVHQVYVFLEWMMPPNTQDGNLAFTNLIDSTISAIRESYTGAVLITDPATQQESQLLVIGDRLTYKYVPPRNLGESGEEWFDYTALITFEVQEKVQQFS